MPNQLANETSPYLLQHKDNPVDWYPWGAAALLKARAEDKPIFLSIGYSACHWCHVMERESFENESIAAFLNEHFVSIKVDREERPDLDQIYMQAVVAMHGHGGWPLSAFLTPDQDFFFGGTYWPPTTTARMPGFDRVLASVLDAWHEKREQIVSQSKQITELIGRSIESESEGARELEPALLNRAADRLHRQFDGTYGGFGSAPKFPHPTDLLFLLRCYRSPLESVGRDSPSRKDCLHMVELTLKKMAYGGLFDHLGGGFARYSVDARWLVPHFEKMLYDNALLAKTYVRAFQATGDRFYGRVAEKTLDYLLNDMTDPSGGFYSAEDADSEGEEGKFYVWTPDEIHDILEADVAERFCQLYDVTPSGNFEGRNILNLRQSFAEFAEERGLDKEELRAEMREARASLLAARNQRVRPGRDDKVLTSWNALAIEAFAEAAIALNGHRYAEASENAAEFIWSQMRSEDGRLYRSWRDGSAKLSGYLEDYSGMLTALLALYRIRFDEKWIVRAIEIKDMMFDHFRDSDSGAFFFTADDHEKLIARTVNFQDGALPSGNSMAATGLIQLGQTIGDRELIEAGHAVIEASSGLLNRAPQAAGQMLVAYFQFLENPVNRVIFSRADSDSWERLVRRIHEAIPIEEPVVLVSSKPTDSSPFEGLIEGRDTQNGESTMYVCRDFKCELPVVGEQKIEAALASEG